MPCKIVKPYDWQYVRETRFVVVLEGVTEPGYRVRIFSYENYFGVAPAARSILYQASVTLEPSSIAYASIEVGRAWGPCVVSVINPMGTEVAASGVKFGYSEVTNWLPFTKEAAAVRYPLPLISSAISHTHADRHRTTEILPSLEALCALPDAGDAGVVGAVVVSQPMGYDGLDSLSQSHSVGQEDPAFAIMLASSAWTSTVPYVARFQDVIVQSPSGLVMLGDGLWSDSTLTAFFNDPELRQHDSLFRSNDQVGYLGGPHSAKEMLASSGIEAFPGIPLMISNVGYRNHAHWIMNSLLAVYYCRHEIIAGTICVIVPEYSNYIIDSLLSLGVGRASIIVAPKGFYRLRTVLFPSTLSTHVNRCPPPEIAGMFEMIRTYCRSRSKAAPRRLIYLTRQGSGAQRKISNEDQLITALRQRGFTCIAPHELNFVEEILCVSDADVIVGQLGAALMNIAFAPRKAWIVELASHNYASLDYWVLATTLGQKFVRILARAPSDDTLTLTDFSFEVPLEATLNAIDQVCLAALGQQTRVE